MRRVYWRRRAAVVGALGAVVVVVLALLGAGGGSGSQDGARKAGVAGSDTPSPPPPPPPPELPRGGRVIFPKWRVVSYYGAPQAAQLGELGIGRPATAARKLERAARRYRGWGRPVLPAMELLGTICTAHPGPDGLYRFRQPKAIVDRYLNAATNARQLLILDIQPGYADFLTEAKRLEPWLRKPNVSLALDPEWKMPRGTLPGQVIGHTTAGDINRVSAWMAALVRRHRLPQKLLLVHKFTDDMIRGQRALKQRPGVALTISVDGFGTPELKREKYQYFNRRRDGIYDGFKLFYHEDTNMMSPRATMRLKPRPDFVSYE
jgi:hypothetical protein